MNRGLHTLLILALALGALTLTGCKKPTPEERLTEAVGLFQQGQTARGVIKLQELIRETPDDPLANEARILLARYYTSEGNASRALDFLQAVFDKAGANDGAGARAVEGLATINQQLGEFDKAVAVLEKARSQMPEDDHEARDSYTILIANAKIGSGREDLVPQGVEMLHDRMLNAEEKSLRGFARESLADYHRRSGAFLESNAAYRAYIEAFPDDTVVPQLELAVAINLHFAGEEEQGREHFDTWAAVLRERAGEELDKEAQGRKLLELAANYAAVDRYDEAEALMVEVMGAHTRSRLAIETQFGIAEMYARSALGRMHEEHFERCIAVLEQIARENRGTNIEESARRRKEEVTAQMGRLREYVAELAARADDDATSPTLE
ncbi:MAG: hypothetical protein KF858_06530 [Candidatus Sumerlaeia bacterium]|nr:hypothetical protein [Candidatus Sumerlaeia bacterium]